MRAFACENCGQLVFFENDACLNCGMALGFDWVQRDLMTMFEPRPRCANADLAGCNWLVDAESELCFSCALTRTRPADGDELGLRELRVAEAAKRRLLFELGELGLPIEPRDDGNSGLAFDLLSSASEPVTTGQADGVVTLDLAESDDAHRIATREQMGEPYRTVLGHLRHEIGHYYFPLLVGDGPRLERARELFGDERADYSAALDRHYAEGPPPGWRESFVSAYATMHPSEDWAETFAHYLHIRDALQTAASHGVRVDGPQAPARAELSASPEEQPAPDFESLLEAWLPLTYALNAINRSMGRSDLYPFVLPAPAVEKLSFVHELVSSGVERSG
jgi:hypothetical protein